MGLGDFIDGITGKGAADAAKSAANIQADSAAAARRQQSKFLKQIRSDLAPFRAAGTNALSGLESLISDPNAQLSFIQDNPFFKAISDDATNRLLNVQAARGRLGTGDTPAALQNNLLLLGNDLLQQSIGNRFGLVGIGQNAAAQTGNAIQNIGTNISNLTTGAGDALAAGTVGAANARSAGINNLLGLGLGAGIGASGALGPGGWKGAGLGILLSDRRFKTDVEVIGKLECGIPVCSFRYSGGTQKIIGVMAQDVEKVVPSAVVDVFGVKYVDYDELHRVLN